MALYLGSQRISGVNTTYATTVYNTDDATVNNANQIARNYIAYSNGRRYVGDAPYIFCQTVAPTSGMIEGDIWVETTTNEYATGSFDTSGSTTKTYSFPEWSNYTDYTNNVTSVVSVTANGSISDANLMSISYTITHSYTGSTTVGVTSGTYTYTLDYVNPNGTVNTVATLASTGSLSYPYSTARTTTNTGSGDVAVNQPGGYLRLTMTLNWNPQTALNTTTPVPQEVIVTTENTTRTNPKLPNGLFGKAVLMYDDVGGWV